MQGFFTGFDKVKLFFGTSVFYITALSLVCISIAVNQSRSHEPWMSKNREVYSASTLRLITEINQNGLSEKKNIKRAKITLFENATGFGSEVILDSYVSEELVFTRIQDVLNIIQFQSVSYILTCSKVSCSVDFYSTDPNKIPMAKQANILFSDFLYSFY